MKNFLLGFVSAAAVCLCIAATSVREGIVFKGLYGGEPAISADSPNQAAPWVDFRSNGVPVFQVPNTGVIPLGYGGTGVSTLADLQALVTNAPTSGVTAVANGGTGTNTLAKISWPTNTAASFYNAGNVTTLGRQTNLSTVYFPTNTAQFSTVTNDLVSGAWNLLNAQRGSLTVTLVGTAAGGGLAYSNAASGKQRTFIVGTITNTITIRFQPSSLVAVTNATVLPNTSEINYE